MFDEQPERMTDQEALMFQLKRLRDENSKLRAELATSRDAMFPHLVLMEKARLTQFKEDAWDYYVEAASGLLADFGGPEHADEAEKDMGEQ